MKFYTNTDTLWLSTAYLKQSVFVLRLCPSQREVSPGNHSASNLTAFKSIRYLKVFLRLKTISLNEENKDSIK